MDVNGNAVAAFFNERAAAWDGYGQPDADKINAILDTAGVQSGVSVLDVGCGTGVLFPFYLARGVALATGVDISQGMIEQASAKFGGEPRARFLCADAAAEPLPKHNRCVVFNALPHFADPGALLAALARALPAGGRLTIAHGEGRRAINARHERHASAVSRALPSAEELAALVSPLFQVDALRDDEECYLVSGVRL